MNTILLAQAITELRPNCVWQMDGNDVSTLKFENPSIVPPTQSEIDEKMAELELQDLLNQCKTKASALLYETDWTTIPDVADPANTPYLTNQAEFIAWRSQVRALAVNPVVDPVFPPKPTEIWG